MLKIAMRVIQNKHIFVIICDKVLYTGFVQFCFNCKREGVLKCLTKMVGQSPAMKRQLFLTRYQKDDYYRVHMI